MFHVVLAGEQGLFLDCLRETFFNHDLKIKVVGYVKETEQLVEVIGSSGCDLVVLSDGESGALTLNTIKVVKSKFPEISILILSGLSHNSFRIRCLKAGADAFLLKSDQFQEIASSIEKIKSDRKKNKPGTLKNFFYRPSAANKSAEPCDRLTDREFQVMCLMSSGRSLSEVAHTLGLSVKTISGYRNNIMIKMNWDNNAQMMHYCMGQGLLDNFLDNPNFSSAVETLE